MKKSMISLAVLLTLLSGTAFAQSTTISTNPNQTTVDTTKQKAGGDSAKTAGNADKKGNAMVKDSSKTGAGNAASKIGDAGTRPATNAKSTVKSQPASSAKGAIRKTEPDTVVKKGSGSSPRNTKNNTGTTGNYKNEATKKSSGNE